MTIANNFLLYFNKEMFSPYYRCKIKFPSIELPLFTCNSVLHAFELSKLIFFGNYDKLFFAASMKFPKECIQAGYDIPNYNSVLWRNVKQSIMYQIEFQKYLQNKDLQMKLISDAYKDIEFVYTNPLDSFWGIGTGEYTSMALHKDQWNGKNIHGKIIKQVREDIIRTL